MLCSLVSCFFASACLAQPITGIWRGKITKGAAPFTTTYRVEVKMVLKGDCLMGTSYYYNPGGGFFRFSIAGYLDPVDGSLHWWDDALIEKKASNNPLASANTKTLKYEADFNCPGSGVMMLNGQAVSESGREMEVELQKHENAVFNDHWNDWIAQWHHGAAEPEALYTLNAQPSEWEETKQVVPPAQNSAKASPAASPNQRKKWEMVIFSPNKKGASGDTMATVQPMGHQPKAAPSPPHEVVVPVEEKYKNREEVTQVNLPLAGDSIEFQFFDNAEIDGDSIALFLDGKLLAKHIKLTGQPFTLKLATATLSDSSRLSMVAENLGAIPPNTAYMLAYIGGERYSARLTSTEQTTAAISFQKK
jgi:hypothetical protein